VNAVGLEVSAEQAKYNLMSRRHNTAQAHNIMVANGYHSVQNPLSSRLLRMRTLERPSVI
jgi:hypothetical protein